MKCRCGYTEEDEDHPCHGQAYTCRKPAKVRAYNTRTVSLAGMQMKFGADVTWACDECWEQFIQLTKESLTNG